MYMDLSNDFHIMTLTQYLSGISKQFVHDAYIQKKTNHNSDLYTVFESGGQQILNLSFVLVGACQ